MRDFEVDPLRESALFARAMELEPRGRDAFLARECEGNAGLLLAVQQLLHAAEQAQSNPSWELSALTIEAAAIASQWNPGGVERYQILDCIGAGGMGVVYRARRDDRHFDKTVAVKVVQSREPAIVERFRQERQIMADLDHPNIAHVLDGGLTREGMPFLVMEFVDGVPIDRYVSDHGLAQRARLVLFRKVCSAVSHAHSKLIVHRDLKPANILVTPAGEPKLLDFGIAKLLDESAPRTITSATALTPEYASPEQITGGAITTASDVYSLGVLLYQMLRGRRPHRDTGSAVELAALIVKGEFDPLRGVDGDLANIVHMALRREPERRYQSVEQLSEDLRRYMEGYPVLACPDTRAYRFAKFAVRNRLPLIAGSLTFLALLAGTSVALWQARLAQRRFDDVRKIANTYLFEIHDAIRDLPGSTPARKLVAKGALEYLDRLSSESGGDPGLLREVAGAYMRLGAVQGSPRFASLGDREGAIASYGKAKAILQRLSTRSPRDAGTAVELARARIALSELLQAMGDLSNAEREDAGATTLLESQAAVNPGDANIQEMLSAAYRLAADIQANPDLPNLGKPQEALRYLEKALRIWRERARLKPEDRETRFRLGLVLGRIAAIRISLADRSGGEAALEEALQVNQQLVREEPLNAVYRREVAIYSNNIARNLVRMDSVAAALEYGDRSGAIFRELAAADPDNAEAQEALADSLSTQAFLIGADHNPVAALSRMQQAITVYARLGIQHPGYVSNGYTQALLTQSNLALDAGMPAKAIESAREVLAREDVLLKRDASNAGALSDQAYAFTLTGQAHQAAANQLHDGPRIARLREACSWFLRADAAWKAVDRAGKLTANRRPRMELAAAGLASCTASLAPADRTPK